MTKHLLFSLLLFTTLTSTAQTKREIIKQRVDSVLTSKYNKVNYDTNYISRPQGTLTLRATINESGNTIRYKGVINNLRVRTRLSTDNATTVSFEANYKGLSAGFSLNPKRLSGKNKDNEMQLNIYTNSFSLDAKYQMAKTLSGDFKSSGNTLSLNRGMTDFKMLNLTGYYVFNSKRFSYSAAFTQAYLQKRSVGSWLAGISYQGGRLKYPGNIAKEIPQLKLSVANIAVGAGYAYNFVIGERWLLHASTLPTIVVYNHNNMSVGTEKRKVGYHFPELIFNGRIAVVFNINQNQFIAMTGNFTNSLYHSNNSYLMNNNWIMHLSYGIRL